MITPTIKELVNLLVHAYEKACSESLIIDREMNHTIAITYAQAIVVASRGGADAPDEQMDMLTMAGELIHELDMEWDDVRYADAREFSNLTKAVLNRVEQIAGEPTPTNAELIDEEIAKEANERELRLKFARRIVPKFATAAYRWLGPDSTDMSRFAAEQRADVLADELLQVVPDSVYIDPMRIAQNVRNDMRNQGLAFSPKDIIDRLTEALA